MRRKSQISRRNNCKQTRKSDTVSGPIVMVTVRDGKCLHFILPLLSMLQKGIYTVLSLYKNLSKVMCSYLPVLTSSIFRPPSPSSPPSPPLAPLPFAPTPFSLPFLSASVQVYCCTRRFSWEGTLAGGSIRIEGSHSPGGKTVTLKTKIDCALLYRTVMFSIQI